MCGTHLVVYAALEEPRAGKVARATRDEGDVDGAAKDGEFCGTKIRQKKTP